jgi:hypothetical protein
VRVFASSNFCNGREVDALQLWHVVSLDLMMMVTLIASGKSCIERPFSFDGDAF